MRLSIRIKYTMILVAIIVGVVVAIGMVNRYYLETYAIKAKQGRLLDIRTGVISYIDSGYADEEEQALEKMGTISNVQIVILLHTQLGTDQVIYSGDILNEPGSWTRLNRFLEGHQDVSNTLYLEGEDYQLYRTEDALLGNQMECIGWHGECYYILTTPLESINESVRLTNEFLTYVGVIAAIAGGMILFFVTGSLTRPIKQLANLSEQMADQNFGVRYQGGRNDEIEDLGQSMNHMSDNLRQVISELKETNIRLEMANEQLEEDIREKDRIAEARREFISNVSHELKTPLALIQGYAEGLRDGISEDPESRSQYCDVIIDESGRMNTLVKRLLNLDEIEYIGRDITRQRFNLTDLLNGVLQATSMLAGDRKVTVSLDSPETLMVEADEFLLEEAMQNFLSNAWHYVSDPGEIRVSAGPGQTDSVRISVFNTGSPIPPQEIDRIWEKFYKVDKARTRKYGGSGIGLSIVKAIADAHGGRCGAENTEDGVTFWLEIPQASGEKSI